MLLIILMTALTNQCMLAQEPTEIIKRHIDAIGLNANPVKTYKMDATRYMGDHAIFRATVYHKAPDMWRIEYLNGNGTTPVVIVRGDSAWKVADNGKVTAELEIFSRLFQMTFPDYLAFSSVLAKKTKSYPKTKLNQDMITTFNNKSGWGYGYYVYYINPENSLIDAAFIQNSKGAAEYKIIFKDYGLINGINCPMVISNTEMSTGGEYMRHVRKNITVNIPLDDKLFKKPIDTVDWNAPKYKEFTSMEDAMKSPLSVYFLKLDNKQLTAIPEGISKMKNLQYLNLGFNQITEIPDFICTLTQLTDLILYYNQISKAPECIGNLTNIRALYLSNNKLTALPEGIGRLNKIITLSLSDNPLVSLPAAIINLKRPIIDISLPPSLILTNEQKVFINSTRLK